MAFALHVEKYVKSDLKGLEIHNERKENYELSNKDIDKSKSHENYHIGEYSDNYVRKFNKIKKERITGIVRKTSVAGVSIVVSADDNFFKNLSKEREREFFEISYNKIVDKFGKNNIISAVVHKDENTPHMHVMVCPVTSDGRLTAKELFGRKNLIYLQDIALELQKEGFEIERGDSERKVKHLSEEEYKLKKEAEKLALLREKQEQERKNLEISQNLLIKDEERIKDIKKLYADIEQIKNEILKNKTFWYENVYKINSFQLDKIIQVAKNSENILNYAREKEKESNSLKEENKKLLEKQKDYNDKNSQNKSLKKEIDDIKAIFSKIEEMGNSDVLQSAKSSLEYNSLKFDYEKKEFFKKILKKAPNERNSFEKELYNIENEKYKKLNERKMPKSFNKKLKMEKNDKGMSR